MKTMTPLKFAKDECANFNPDGSCLGVRPEDLVDSGQRKQLGPRDKCLLYDKTKRCLYFEEVILPLADKPAPVDEPGLQLKRQAARLFYLETRNLIIPDESNKRRCDCGNPLEFGKRFCQECLTNRNKECFFSLA